MEYKIRLEEEKDFREVEELTREAFWNLYVPGCDEHYLVHKMRSHPDFIKDLAFVAELDGKIVANIMYTKAALIDELGRELEIATFGPLCVHPSCQRQGLGGALIGHTKKILIAKGIKAIVILGDSHNYCKHGFKSASDYGISDADGGFPSGMLALELEEKRSQAMLGNISIAMSIF
ncbi:N-acetyltransferase [Treponema sp.]